MNLSNITEFEVDGWNNLCRVFELPKDFIEDYCHGGGHATNFQMIDWFYPLSQEDVPIAACSKEIWKKEVGEIKTVTITLKELQGSLVPFMQEKPFIKAGRKYLIICDFGATILFEK